MICPYGKQVFAFNAIPRNVKSVVNLIKRIVGILPVSDEFTVYVYFVFGVGGNIKQAFAAFVYESADELLISIYFVFFIEPYSLHSFRRPRNIM